jgi:hypothetical protein
MPAGLLGHFSIAAEKTTVIENFNPRLLPTFSFICRSFSKGDPCDRY